MAHSAWTLPSDELTPGTFEYRAYRSGSEATYAEVLDSWAVGDRSLLEVMEPVLEAQDSDAYLWETPPITQGTVDRPFTFVRIDSPTLARMHPEPEVFASYYPQAEDGIVTFTNLGGDAVLIAPTPDEGTSYPHLAAFSRSAPPEKRVSLWRAVGEAVKNELGDRPLWISTCGTGVAWLHVRLDSYPKYYHHHPYRSD